MTDSSARGAAQMDNGVSGKVRVWDPLVRVFHWRLFLAFKVAWLTAEEISAVNEFAGYAIACLVAFRLVWGLVGSIYSRFVRFLKGPGESYPISAT